MTQIYLIRHAQSVGNLYRRVLGWHDGGVTQLGMTQIAALEARFRSIPVHAVYSSDLLRARQTAQAVAGPKQLPIHPEAAFREINVGIYTNVPYGELRYHHPQLYADFFSYSPRWAPPEGETFQQVSDRITPAFFRIAREHPGQTVAVFSHAMAICCLQSALRGTHPSQVTGLPLGENTAVSCYEVQGDKFRILFENDASHLPPEAATLALRKKTEALYGPSPMVWFRNMDLAQEARDYAEARQDAWAGIHGSLRGFDGEGFLAKAQADTQWDPRSLQRAMWEDRPVGILQLATLQKVGNGVGHIPFLYVSAPFRHRGIGLQLIGQAASTYQAMGRKSLQLQCAPENEGAQRFYRRCGFVKKGQVPGAQGPVDLLELPL